MTTLETLITQYGEACMESARNSGYDGADKHDSSVARMDAARAALVLEVESALAARQAAEPTMPAGVEHVAAQWDGCLYDAIGGSIDIGAAIREAYDKFVALSKFADHPAPQGQEGDAELRKQAMQSLETAIRFAQHGLAPTDAEVTEWRTAMYQLRAAMAKEQQ